MSEKRKCRNCGRLFDPKGKDELFCSSLCRTTGLFVGGGGDTSKPSADGTSKKGVESKKIRQHKESHKVNKRGSDSKFPRVKELFELPLEKRWNFAKTFSEDEMAYARRIASRMLNEDRLIDELCLWEIPDSETVDDGENYGDSDDGSI